MKVKKRIFLFKNRLLYGFRIENIKGKRKLVIHDKYRNAVKLLGHGTSILGLVSSFIAFSSVWISFIFAAVLEIVGYLFSKIFFSYTNMYVHPIPDFEIDPEKWIAMGFGYANSPQNQITDIPVITMVFSDEEYGRKIFSFIKTLSYGQLDDKKKNILARVVIIKPDCYVFFLYPNPMRRTAKEFFRKAVRSNKKEQSVQNRLFTFFWFGKHFKIDKVTYFPTFHKRFINETPTIFQFHVLDLSGKSSQISGTDSIYLYSLKIFERTQIRKKILNMVLLSSLSKSSHG